MLRVKNNGADGFAAKYDGVLYSFPAGGGATIPLEAAKHIFGLGQGDKTAVLARHGWLISSVGLNAAMAKLNSFAFSQHTDIEPEPLPETIKVEIAENEQRSAPLQTGAEGEASSDGLNDPSVTASPVKLVSNGAKEPVINGTISLKKKVGA